MSPQPGSPQGRAPLRPPPVVRSAGPHRTVGHLLGRRLDTLNGAAVEDPPPTSADEHKRCVPEPSGPPHLHAQRAGSQVTRPRGRRSPCRFDAGFVPLPESAPENARSKLAMPVSLERPKMAELIKLPEGCLKDARQTFPKIAPDDRGELRRFPKNHRNVPQQLSNNCLGSRNSAQIPPRLADLGHMLAKVTQFWHPST